MQAQLPVWLGVGGTPASFVRAGTLGLPLMVAIIGGETRRFRPLIDLYREAGRRAGFRPEQLRVGLPAFGYVGATTSEALEEFYPGYATTMTRMGKMRGWGPITRAGFDAVASPHGAMLIGGPAHVAAKIKAHSAALGSVDRVVFQMDSGGPPNDRILHSIDLMGKELAPLLR